MLSGLLINEKNKVCFIVFFELKYSVTESMIR